MSKSIGPELQKDALDPFEGEALTHSKRATDGRVVLKPNNLKESSTDLNGSSLSTSINVRRKGAQNSPETTKLAREHKLHHQIDVSNEISMARVRLNNTLGELRGQSVRQQEAESAPANYSPTILDRLVSFLARILKSLEKKLLGKRKAAQGSNNKTDQQKSKKKRPGLLKLLTRRS